MKIKGQPFDIAVIQAYAPTSASSDEDLEVFYEDLDRAKDICHSQDIIIMMGDLNANVGKGCEENIVGGHGLGTRNERGDMWVEWCKRNSQVITNTWFKNHPRRLWTWKRPDEETRNQIDFVTIDH